MPGSTFKVLTTASPSRTAWSTSTRSSPTRTRGCRRRPTTRSRTSAASAAAATCPRCSRAAATSRSPSWPSTSARSAMVEGVADWGVGETFPIDLPRPAASTFGDVADLAQNLPLLAIRGFGQNEDQMVPLHMAMVASTVANGGQMMKPYVVQATLDHDGAVLEQTDAEVWKTPISPETAATMQRPDAQRRQAAARRAAASPSTTGSRPPPRPAPPSSTAPAAGALERLDHRLRPGRRPAVRGRRDAQGHQRRDQASTGGRLAGPIAKQVLDHGVRRRGGRLMADARCGERRAQPEPASSVDLAGRRR